jgi:hypothetical protein
VSAPGKAGAIQPVEVWPKLRSSVRLVASVAWSTVTFGHCEAVAKARNEPWLAWLSRSHDPIVDKVLKRFIAIASAQGATPELASADLRLLHILVSLSDFAAPPNPARYRDRNMSH